MSDRPGARKPRAFDADDPSVVASKEAPDDIENDIDHILAEDQEDLGVDGDTVPPKRSLLSWGSLLFTAAFSLFMLAAGLWFSRFVSVAVARDDWLGWIAKGLALVVALAAVVLILRELIGIIRLSRLTGLRLKADEALRNEDLKLERSVVSRLKAHARRTRDQKWDLKRFREQERHMRTPGALLGLADRVLLSKADTEAKNIIYRTARRVGVITAVVPIAFLVVGFVLFENLKMMRNLAGVYGGRPGFFGGLRLFGWVIAHIAATGAIALTDDLWGQFFGQDILRRVSRRLGEGAFVGAMTARLGVAAMDVCRPLPYIETKKPRARHVFYQAFPDMKPSKIVGKIVGSGGRKRAEPQG